MPAQQLQDDVLGLHPVRQPPGELDLDHPRAAELVAVPGHRHRDVEPARAQRDHADRPGHRGVRVRADQQRARPGEPLEVDVVGDAVARRGVAHAVAAAERAQVVVLGHVALVDLQHVVIDVQHGELHGDPVDVEGLELHGAHRPGGVLDEDLVDATRSAPGSSAPARRCAASSLRVRFSGIPLSLPYRF